MTTVHIRLVFFLLVVAAVANCQTSLQNLLEGYGAPASKDALGSGIIGLGDINNDGWDDFAVSASGLRKTFIYFGGPGKLDAIPDVAIKGGNTMVMGDLNGDGRKDLVIWMSIGGDIAGRDTILVYFGNASASLRIDTIPGFIFIGENLGDNFGSRIAIGDLNTDGYDDLVVGAYHYDSHKGKVYIYFGKKILTTAPDYTALGDTVISDYGSVVSR